MRVPKPNHKRRKPKQSSRTRITEKDYHKATEYWGSECIVCGSPQIELHHVKFRSHGGSGRWHNLLPLCQHHHTMAHTDNSIRRTFEWKLEQEFGNNYWMDEFDLWDRGLIDYPTIGEYEKYFERVSKWNS